MEIVFSSEIIVSSTIFLGSEMMHEINIFSYFFHIFFIFLSALFLVYLDSLRRILSCGGVMGG